MWYIGGYDPFANHLHPFLRHPLHAGKIISIELLAKTMAFLELRHDVHLHDRFLGEFMGPLPTLTPQKVPDFFP